MGSYSVAWCVRHLMGQPLYCSAKDAGLWGEKVYGEGSTLYAWLSNIALLPWLPGFLPQAFPATISYLMSSQSMSLQSTKALALGLFHNPYTTAPSCHTFYGTCVPVQGMYGCVWFSFHLGCHRSVVSLSALNISPLTQKFAPIWGSDLCFSSRSHQGQIQSYKHSCFSP